MGAKKKQGPEIGTMGWMDLSVKDAPRIRDFYCKVIGWTSSEVDMGDYADFSIHAPSGKVVTGICHARGSNRKIPSVWLPYFVVASVARSVAAAKKTGGRIVDGPRKMGGGRFAVVRDPAGVVFGLWQN